MSFYHTDSIKLAHVKTKLPQSQEADVSVSDL